MTNQRKFYFGFGQQADYPEFQCGFYTSLEKEKLLDLYHYRTNPFAPRLRRILKEYKDNLTIGLNYHDIVVKRGEPIRPVVYAIAKKLIAAGWLLADFNENMAVQDIWEENEKEN